MSEFLIRNRQGFGKGLTPITRIGEQQADTGINFGILRLETGERFDVDTDLEGALLLIAGEVEFIHQQGRSGVSRASMFDEAPSAIHFPRGQVVGVEAKANCELCLLQVENQADFPVRLFRADNLLACEHRGQGQLGDTAYRIVRTIFDARNRPEAKLVLGEVVNFPGRWSSYPPHHHRQPEIYHYRFTEPHGYGHSELGDEVLKVQHYDTIKILDQRDHAQVAAPGYGMYYIWAIRHLAEEPYSVPEFSKPHDALIQGAPVWQPRELST